MSKVLSLLATGTTVQILTEELVKAMEELVDSLRQVGGGEKDKLGGAERMEDVLKLRRTLVAAYKEWLQAHSFYDTCLCRYFFLDVLTTLMFLTFFLPHNPC